MSDDRWARTTFADSTEAAIHMALIGFTLRLQERRAQRQPLWWPDESDIFMEYRRKVRDLATGELDADAYIEEYTDVV